MKEFTKAKWITLAIAILFLYFNKLFPLLPGLNDIGSSIIYIFIGALIMLIGVDYFWGTLLSLVAFAHNGIYSFTDVVKMSFGQNSSVVFVAFCIVFLMVIERTGLLKRIALWFITRNICKKNPWYFIMMFFLAEVLLGTIMNVTANVLLFSSLMAEICRQAGLKKGENRTAAILLLCCAIFGAFGYSLTPIGHPSTIIAVTLFESMGGASIGQYCVVGYIVGVIGFAFFLGILKLFIKPDLSMFKNMNMEAITGEKTRLTKEEKFVGIIYICVLITWVLPSFIKDSAPDIYAYFNRLTMTGPTMIAIVLLCVVKINGKHLMNFAEDYKNTSWAAAFTMMIAMVLGTALNNADGGIIPWAATSLEPVFGGMNPHIFVLIMILLCGVLTQFMSCTVAITIVGSLCIALISGGVVTGVSMPGLVIGLGIAQGNGYATAPGGTPAAIASSQGWVPAKIQLGVGMFYGVVPLTIVSYLGYLGGMLLFG